jgi:hypothetical protein
VFTTFHQTITDFLASCNSSFNGCVGISTLSKAHHAIASSILAQNFSTHSFADCNNDSLDHRKPLSKNSSINLSVNCLYFFHVGAKAFATFVLAHSFKDSANAVLIDGSFDNHFIALNAGTIHGTTAPIAVDSHRLTGDHTHSPVDKL